MFKKQWIGIGLASACIWIATAQARDFKISLPRRSHLTTVQRLNQEGVEAIRKHGYEKAETLFYKAYLLDPDDPFTLNNLGYISELQGQVDRAQRFYALALEQPTDAVIAISSSKRVEGHPMKEALAVTDQPLQVNHDNVEAVRLLSQGRAPEVDLMLQRTLKTDPNNIFTLNNLGVAKEMEGESDEALKYYDAASTAHSDAAAVVTLNRSWRGKPVTEMAAQNAKELRSRQEEQKSLAAKLAQFNIRGVSALNRNDLKSADNDFRSAYALDPNDAFAVNNVGYLAEMDGDRETAQFFYDKAQAVGGANSIVGLATRRSAEGSKLFQIAADNDTKVAAKVAQDRDANRQQAQPIVLRHRDNTPVEEPINSPPATPAPATNPQ
jgi:Flp pilus assembly protein TadD